MKYHTKAFLGCLLMLTFTGLIQTSVASDLIEGNVNDEGQAIVTRQCTDNRQFDYPFQNPDLSFEERVSDLVGRLTLEEKISQMMNDAPAIERLGIPNYNWWNECLHGVGRSGINVTVFPQAIGMAATFNDEALLKMATITSDEARAIHHESNRTGHEGEQYRGLTFWTPNINIFRDPRWGRGQETYGEDPYLTARMGKAMVRGLQGEHPDYLKVSACAKHFAVHSGPEPGRNKFDVKVDTYELWDTYLPAFEVLVNEENVSSVMCAYNRYDGEPCCGNDLLMMEILRNQWRFEGYVTSDCGAINDFYVHHKTHPNSASAAADAVLHGTDLECGNVYQDLVEAVRNNQLDERDIDVSVKRLFMTRMKLGMFDSEGTSPYSNIPMSVVESKANKDHALKMARESMVLLRNNKKTLPLSSKIKKVVVMGPNAHNEEIQLGNYNGVPTETITPLEAIERKNKVDVTYVQGTSYVKENKDLETEALLVIKEADLVIFVGGISPRLEGEDGDAGKEDLKGFYGGDRTNIALPEVQTAMMKNVKEAGIPLVFVCMSGSAIGFEWETKNADAIIQAWYGGQSAGAAIADLIFGDYNPAGRLPLTFYKNVEDLPPIEDYSMANRTYRYYKGEVLYPFGYGLSFTGFNYKWGQKPESIYSENETISFSVKVKNSGKIDGDEVVQAYITYPSKMGLPAKELRQFKRVTLTAGDEQDISMTIPISDLRKWNEASSKRSVINGTYSLFIGGNSADRQLSYEFKIIN